MTNEEKAVTPPHLRRTFWGNSAVVFTLIIFLLGLIGIMSMGDEVDLPGALLFTVFVLWPLLITIVVGYFTPRRLSRRLLVISTIFFACLQAYVVRDALFVNVDPQSPIALVLAPLLALPVMIPLWIAAIVLQLRSRRSESSSQS